MKVEWTNLPPNLGVPGPNGTIILAADDYPYRTEPVVVHGTFESAAAHGLQLTEVQADCARIFVDGVDCGWCWGPEWSVPVRLNAGRHELEVRLVPSTFNLYGPRHHVDGDPNVVSPAQFQYVKNFADRPDAPLGTRVSWWHFKPLGIGERLAVTSAKGR